MNQPTPQELNVKAKKRKATSTKWFVGIAIIGLSVVGISLTQINATVVYFYTPDEAVAQAEQLSKKVIKVGGMVTPSSVEWKAQTLDLKFVVSDLKGADIAVAYRGAPPDMFKEGQGVVVEGSLAPDGKSMSARKLLVKHSEEYKKPGDHAQSMNKELLQRSILGTDASPSDSKDTSQSY